MTLRKLQRCGRLYERFQEIIQQHKEILVIMLSAYSRSFLIKTVFTNLLKEAVEDCMNASKNSFPNTKKCWWSCCKPFQKVSQSSSSTSSQENTIANFLGSFTGKHLLKENILISHVKANFLICWRYRFSRQKIHLNTNFLCFLWENLPVGQLLGSLGGKYVWWLMWTVQLRAKYSLSFLSSFTGTTANLQGNMTVNQRNRFLYEKLRIVANFLGSFTG